MKNKTVNAVRKTFYQECIKNDLTADEVENIIIDMYTHDSPKDVMAGIKAGRQRKLNARAKKAWETRRANSFDLPLKKSKKKARKARMHSMAGA